MSDVHNAAPPPANSPQARSPDGTIKSAPTAADPTANAAPAPPAPGDTPPAKPDGTSVLNSEAKPGDAKPADAPAGAPEKYEAWTVPDGFTLDEKVSTEANELFKSLNLDQASGQKLVDFYAAKAEEAAKAPYQLWEQTQEDWVKTIKADPEIGGKLDQVKTTVAKAIDGLGDPKLAADFRAALDFTGAGNNPAFVKAFYRLAQKVTEGTVVSGRGPVEVKNPTGRPASAAAAMYPHLKQG